MRRQEDLWKDVVVAMEGEEEYKARLEQRKPGVVPRLRMHRHHRHQGAQAALVDHEHLVVAVGREVSE